MHIVLSINGEGRGHLSRSIALAEALERRHRISFCAPAHLAGELAARFPRSRIIEIPYLAFEQKGFAIDYPKTIAKNFSLFVDSSAVQNRLASEFRLIGAEGILSDFEPFASRTAKRLGLPVLQLNHPGIVSRVASFSPAAIASRLVARYMMDCSDQTLLCSFFSGDVGPIIRKALRDKPLSNGGRFVAYVKDRYRGILEPLFESLGAERFSVFPDPDKDYESELAACSGLIAPAGHQSISEALALGKPAFVIPVKGQFEQELNARKLRESGFGDWAYFEDVSLRLPAFVSRIESYHAKLDEARASPGPDARGFWACSDDTLRAASLAESFVEAAAARSRLASRRPAGVLAGSFSFSNFPLIRF